MIVNRFFIFEFKGLKLGIMYIVDVRGCIVMIISSFCIFFDVFVEIFLFGVISCNKIFIIDMLIVFVWDFWIYFCKFIEVGKVDLFLYFGD